MELGNIVFGNARGQFPIKRGSGWEAPLYKLLAKVDPDNAGTGWFKEFENDVFSVFPYYWGDCTCGYDQKESEWSKAHPHSQECYRSLVRAELIERGWKVNPRVSCLLDEPKGMSYDEQEKIKNEIRKRLCAQLDLPYPRNSMSHCTCDHEKDWQAWCQENGHNEDCLIIKPNFRHKATGFEIQWYKHPLRDSYRSQRLGLKRFRKIINECIKSLG